MTIVRDLSGQAAVQIEVRVPDWASEGGLEQTPAVVLHTCEDSELNLGGTPNVLAYCKIGRRMGSDGEPAAYIYNAAGVLFGTIGISSSQVYSLVNGKGSIRLSLEGDFKDNAVNIWDDHRVLFGDISPQCDASFDHKNEYWQLHVLANMDV